MIGCAVVLGNGLGASLLNVVYFNALELELKAGRIPLVRESMLPVFFRGTRFGSFKADVVVDSRLVVELKAA